MTIIVDTGAIYALYDADDQYHELVKKCLQKTTDTLILPQSLLSEIDYLLFTWLGFQAQQDFLADLSEGGYLLYALEIEDIKNCISLLEKYESLSLGLADVSVMVIADKLNTEKILTVDQRDFRAVKNKKGKPFQLLPFDMP